MTGRSRDTAKRSLTLGAPLSAALALSLAAFAVCAHLLYGAGLLQSLVGVATSIAVIAVVLVFAHFSER